MVTYCRCGLGFFGRDTQQADDRLDDHLRAHPDGFIILEVPVHREIDSPLLRWVQAAVRRGR